MQGLLEKAKKIKLVIFDVDGVLTDGRLYIPDEQMQYKAFHCHDGLGIKLLMKSGINVGIITSHKSSLITHRMQTLGIEHVYQGQEAKMPAYLDLTKTLQLSDEQVCYVGDDLPDLPLIRKAGLGITVANAPEFVRRHADWQTRQAGGHGAAREICELIMTAQQTLESIYSEYLDG
jgi:3-deoxy-D-manno-octulosonate 8-phosphate phosphatase (KDO 8-P phosphatase)